MGKFIVDTSVWIDFFRGRLSPLVFENLVEGIRSGLAAVTDIIRNEILTGAASQRQFRELRKILTPLDCLRIADDDLSAFDEFTWGLRRRGLKGKYTDAAISFLAARHKAPVLSFDRYFHRLAKSGIINVIQVEGW